jgi:PAS domain S-box-containing protein
LAVVSLPCGSFRANFPTAVYTTDAAGRITFFNEAAAALWGCRPELGKSEWCGSWRLYWPDGRPMTHSKCPMAVALKEKREIRGAEAIAERPDGTRIPFLAYPTPLFNDSDELIGAVNTLVEITEHNKAEDAAARLAAIIEASDDAIVSKALNGIIKTWNAGAERLFGYTAEEVIGRPITILIPPDHIDEEPAILERIRRGEHVDHYETVRRRKDGSLIEISLSVSPIKDAAGRVTGASKVARDISERVKVEEAEQHLAAIVESSDDAIISKDLNGIITSWNAGAQRLYGYTAEEVIGNPVTILMPPEHQDEEPVILERIRQGERIDHYETVRRRKDGSLVDVSLSVSPLKDRHGRIIGSSKIARDISERKRAQNELAASEQRFRSLFDFAPMAVFLCDYSGVIQAYNERAAQIWGRRPVCGDPNEKFCGSLQLRLPSGEALPHDHSPIVDVLRTGEGRENVEVVVEREDGSQVLVLVNFAPLKNARGEVTGAVTSFIDISERKQAQEQQRLLFREMNHRVKNLFTLAGTMVALSARYTKTSRELAQAVSERLVALAHAHDLTLPDITNAERNFTNAERNFGRATTLLELARTILAPYETEGGGPVSISGPDVPIAGKAAMGVALLLHEMATNAAKYGALTRETGRVDIGWRIAGDELKFEWRERGGPPIERRPDNEGFGSLLARLTVTDRLNGTISHDWSPEGLTISLSAPLAQLVE